MYGKNAYIWLIFWGKCRQICQFHGSYGVGGLAGWWFSLFYDQQKVTFFLLN